MDEAQPQTVVDEIATTGVRCDLVDAVHGSLGPERIPATLLVFKITIIPVDVHHRLRSVTITIQFNSADKGDHDGINIFDMEPQGHFAIAHTLGRGPEQKQRGISVGINPANDPLGATGMATVSGSWEYSGRKPGLTVLGMALSQGAATRSANAVRWIIRQNSDDSDGISCLLHGAVLLRRRGNIPFSANATLKTEAVRWWDRVASLFSHQNVVTPVDINPSDPPKFSPHSGLMDCLSDLARLDSLPLAEFSNIQNVEAPSLRDSKSDDAADLELGAKNNFTVGNLGVDIELEGTFTPTTHRRGKKPSTWPEDEPFLKLASGTPLSRAPPSSQYAFKRFEKLSLFNLRNYEHKLVTLYETLNKEGWKDTDSAKTLAQILPKYHEAMLSFANVSKLKILSAQDSAVVATFLSRQPGMATYNNETILDTVDLDPRPDRLRRLMGGFEKKLRRRISPSTELLVLDNRLMELPPIGISKHADKAASFVVLLVGGIFLLIPLFVLTYVRVQKYQLGFVVLFVFLFSLVTAGLTKATNQELLGATAAYTAVIFIFINQNPT
jgi:hypothetical protein